jgi:hypothetical protein
MQPNELTNAKIQAALKILEWSRDDIEPGIDGAADKAHIALAEAFKEIYEILGEAIEGRPEASGGHGSGARPIGDEGQAS